MPGNPWFGNANGNTIYATWSVYNSDQPGPEVRGNGGNDLIIRDWTGYYEQDGGGDWMDMVVNGGNGVDTVYYNQATQGVSADLESPFGYGLASTPGSALGVDRLYSVENLGGSNYADILSGSSHNNVMWGFAGNDEMYGDAGSDTITGDSGFDTIDGGTGSDSLFGGNQNDVIDGGFGADTIDGGNHHDAIDGGYNSDVIYGGAGNDTIEGGRGNDVIEDGAGHDDIDAGAQHDTVYVSDGADTVDLGRGHDTVYVDGFGDNTIDGGAGSDTAVFEGNAAVNVNLWFGFVDRGVEGFDSIVNVEDVVTYGGNDTVVGTSTSNDVTTGNGADYVLTFQGDDEITAGSGNDTVDAGSDEDIVLGGFGSDNLFGGSDDDVVNGGGQADTLRGGQGDDTMTGGSSADTFVFDTGDLGIDTITDFSLAQDTLLFGEDFLHQTTLTYTDIDEELMVWNEGGHALLAANTQESGWEFIARFNNITANQLSAALHDVVEVEGEIGDVVTLEFGGSDMDMFA